MSTHQHLDDNPPEAVTDRPEFLSAETRAAELANRQAELQDSFGATDEPPDGLLRRIGQLQES